MSQAERKSLWSASPLVLAVIGLLGTGVGAVLQGFLNNRLEREKFEFSLIQKALSTSDKDEAARNLIFLLDVGFISQFDADKIRELAKKPNQLPTFLGAAIRDQLISVHDAKSVLQHLSLYSGPINDEADPTFKKALADFQLQHNLTADGLIGPATYAKLREAWPEYFATSVPGAPGPSGPHPQ